METKTQVNQQVLRDAIKQELIRCAQDPIYFMKKYYWIQHPTKGRMQFGLYLFQEKVLTIFQQNEYNIVNKSRQLGISTLVSAYSLWMMLFNKDKNILVVATKQDTAKNLVTKVSFAYDHLPNWIKEFAGGTEFNNKLSIKLNNGSQIKAVSAAADSGRSEAVSLLVLDEAAFIDNIETIFTAAQQTLATGGRCIAISTPNGTGNWFHKEFTKAEIGENKFIAIRLPWTVHPERTQVWRDEQDKILGKREAAQECDCDFSTSGATVIEPDILKWYEEQIKQPIEKRFLDHNYWLWEYPNYEKTYAIIVDVARGDGKDFSTIQVMEIEEAKQVAEYRGQPDTRDLGRLAISVATEWNMGLLIVENTGIGWDVIQTAIEAQYPNIYYSPRTDTALTNVELYLSRFDRGDGMVPGFSTTQKTRPLAISKLTSYIHDKSCVIQSKRTHEELSTFVWKAGKAQALEGYNDDLVMPLAIGLFLRDTALRFRQTGIDLAKASLQNMSRSNQDPGVYIPGQIVEQQPWKMTNQFGQYEDLTWLIK
jgi:hypothetical protein